MKSQTKANAKPSLLFTVLTLYHVNPIPFTPIFIKCYTHFRLLHIERKLRRIGCMKILRNLTHTYPKMRVAADYIYVLVGAAIIALTFNVFLLPNQVASGGVSGISTILKAVFGWEPAFVQWA